MPPRVDPTEFEHAGHPHHHFHEYLEALVQNIESHIVLTRSMDKLHSGKDCSAQKAADDVCAALGTAARCLSGVVNRKYSLPGDLASEKEPEGEYEQHGALLPSSSSLASLTQVSHGEGRAAHTVHAGYGCLAQVFLNSQAYAGPHVEQGECNDPDETELQFQHVSYRALQKRCLSVPVMRPDSMKHMFYHLLTLLVISYDVFTFPLAVFTYHEQHFARVLNYACTVFWTLDLIAHFFIGYYDGVAIVLAPGAIMKRYLKTDFGLCFFLVSVDWLTIGLLIELKAGVLRLARTFRIVRLLNSFHVFRMARLRNSLAVVKNYLFSDFWVATFSAAKMLMFVGVFCHYFACVWYRLGNPHGWVKNTGVEGEFYLYCLSFHWVFSMFTPSRPPPNIKASSIKEELFVIFLLLCGLVVFTAFVGRMSAQIAQAIQNVKQKKTEHTRLHTFLNTKCVSRQLGNHILCWANHHYTPVTPWVTLGQLDTLKRLPERLMVQLQFEVFTATLKAHPMWAQLVESHPAVAVKVCKQAVTELELVENDQLVWPGMPATRMYLVSEVQDSGHDALNFFPAQKQESGLIGDHTQHVQNWHLHFHPSGLKKLSGRIGHHNLNENTGVPIKKREWFGEEALWLVKVYNDGNEAPIAHQGFVVAKQPCEVLAIDAVKFRAMLPAHPLFAQDVKLYAEEFARNRSEHIGVGGSQGGSS